MDRSWTVTTPLKEAHHPEDCLETLLTLETQATRLLARCETENRVMAGPGQIRSRWGNFKTTITLFTANSGGPMIGTWSSRLKTESSRTRSNSRSDNWVTCAVSWVALRIKIRTMLTKLDRSSKVSSNLSRELDIKVYHLMNSVTTLAITQKCLDLTNIIILLTTKL